MLPLTNKAAARKDFVNVRMSGVDTIASQTLLPADQGKVSPLQPGEARKHLVEKIVSRWPYILAGCLVAVLLIVGLVIWRCCCRRRRANRLASDQKALPLDNPKKAERQLSSDPADLSLSQSPNAYTHLDGRSGSIVNVQKSSISQPAAQPYDPQRNAEFLQQAYGHPGPRQPYLDHTGNAIFKPTYEHSQPDHYDDQLQNQHYRDNLDSNQGEPSYDRTDTYSAPYDPQYYHNSHPPALSYPEPSYDSHQVSRGAETLTNLAGRGTRARMGQN